MGRRGMPGRRRQVLQLDENTKTSYLTQTGCYRPDDMFVESKNAAKTGLAMVGEYSDSESDSENEEEQTDPDVESKLNGDPVLKEEESEVVKENTDSLQAEMLEIVGVKKETSADIFLREFQAYQKESVIPVYNREFIVFQKESKENVGSSSSSSSPPPSAVKDPQKEIPTKSSEDASLVTKTDNTPPNKLKTPDIDSQVASFLAEIDALGDEEEKEKSEESNEIGTSANSAAVDQEQNVPLDTIPSESKNKDPLNGNGTKTSISKTVNEEVEENAAASLTPPPPPPPSQEEKIVWPEEPATEWQQCYDENTQHCYYWNINTNEVTWEIPAEFTQYLLLYKEYEEKMAKLMKEGKTKPKKKKIPKKSEKIKKKQNEPEPEMSSKDSSRESQVEYGPHLPPSSSISNQKETCSSPETTEPAPVGQESSKESVEPTYGPMLKPDSPPEGNKEKVEESDAGSNSSSTGKHMHNTAGDDEKEDNTVDDKKPAVADSITSDTCCPVDSAQSVSSKTESSAETPLTANLALMELCKRKFKARISREEESGKSSVDLEVKPPTLPTDVEEGILDIDEVDRELELALERKKIELKCLEEEEEKQSYENVKVRAKRKHHNERASDDSSADEVSTQRSSKRSKEHRESSSKHSKKTKHKKEDANGISSDESSPPCTTSKKSRSSDQKKSHRSHQSKKESRPKKVKGEMLSSKEHVDSKSRSCDDAEEKFKESAIDLSQVIMDKMDFLEIDAGKQSKLQVLYIQLKTRISDWHAGGLSTKYLYVKLQEANQQLGQYEKSGAPTGWSVNWDRTCKRYFYTNNTTGHSQWEYPDPQSKGDGNELPDTLGSMAGSLPLPLLPPPPPPPPPSSSSPSSSAAKAQEASAEPEEKGHQKVTKGCERPERSSSEKERHSSSKSEGRKEKRSRKEGKSSKSSRSKDSSRNKSHSGSSTCSKLKDYVCEMSIYPGEPPPPGTEINLQPSATSVSGGSISRSKNPQLDKSPLKESQSIEDDLLDVMNLAELLCKPATIVCPSASAVSDDMEIDPEDEVATPVPLLPSAEFKINSTNLESNGTIVSVSDAVGSRITTNSSAVISKPPHLTRPAPSVESSASGCESTLSSSGRMEATLTDPSSMSYMTLSSLPELPNESSNSPKLIDNNESTETIKNPKEKKKKKDKVITGTSLTLKKKNVSSLVEKWQKVKKEVEKEDELARHEFSDGD